MRAPLCPKCQSSMAEGFSADHNQGLANLTHWYPGAPVKGWFGIKLPKKAVPITSWRCQRCGYLECYAKG